MRDNVYTQYSFYRALHVPKSYHLPKRISDTPISVVRDLQSYYTSLLSYLYVTMANIKMRIGWYDQLLDDYQKRQFVKITNSNNQKKSKEYIYAMIRNKRYYKTHIIELMEWRGKLEHVSAFIIIAEKIISTASREQTWRQTEYEKISRSQ